jgi:hypothetical protein
MIRRGLTLCLAFAFTSGASAAVIQSDPPPHSDAPPSQPPPDAYEPVADSPADTADHKDAVDRDAEASSPEDGDDVIVKPPPKKKPPPKA